MAGTTLPHARELSKVSPAMEVYKYTPTDISVPSASSPPCPNQHPSIGTRIATMSTHALFAALQSYPDVLQTLSLSSLLLFFSLVEHLREPLSWHRAPDATGPPLHLPGHIADFLLSALSEDHPVTPLVIDQCWTALRGLAWDCKSRSRADERPVDRQLRAGELLPIFLKHGVSRQLGMFL